MKNKGKQEVYINHDQIDDIEDELGIARGSLGSVPDYARAPAIDMVKRILEMQNKTLFREGLYYIVLSDISKNTNFNVKYGNAHADIRNQWFHTAVIEALGEVELNNYANFVKTIGDASLVIFSSIGDVIKWSEKLNIILEKYNKEYETLLQKDKLPTHIYDHSKKRIEQQVKDFKLDVRRLIHVGEVQYTDEYDPLSLAVSQTFKVEKNFARTELGCTGRAARLIEPALIEHGYKLKENKKIDMQGEEGLVMSYYIVKVDN